MKALEYLNDAFARVHGYSVEELVGENLSIFHMPQQMPSVEESIRQLKGTGHFKGGTLACQARWRRKSFPDTALV